MSILLVNANSLSLPLADKSVNCVVTSPPYWGLRDYGVAGQLGLEPTPQEYVDNMVAVFREVWRVLRDDGTLWLNLGDTYNNFRVSMNGQSVHGGELRDKPPGRRKVDENLKEKDLVGIPWRVAFALQADGWYLRSDIIWSKPNPMPESVTDRPTKAHEYVFLLTKRERYYYDNEAVKEKSVDDWTYDQDRRIQRVLAGGEALSGGTGEKISFGATRNRRTVWTIATEPTSEAHFATYPRKLVEPCIKAGCPAGGIVFDPFNGSGTTGIVARALGRNYIGCDLFLAYLQDIARKRLSLDDLDAWRNGAKASTDGYHDLPMFMEAR